MAMGNRQHLSREEIDKKAEEVALHFDSRAFQKPSSPIYQVVDGLKETYGIQFFFNQDLGHSNSGKKILGRFDFRPRQILIDKILPADSPRFRWTLCHEIGHLVLHRNLNPKAISREKPEFVDTRTQLRFLRTAQRSELEWIEWQANQFASALLLPRPIIASTLAAVQRELEIPRPGWIYLDNQAHNLRAYITVLRILSQRLQTSRTVLRVRLLNLGILVDERPSAKDHIQNALRSLFSEEK